MIQIAAGAFILLTLICLVGLTAALRSAAPADAGRRAFVRRPLLIITAWLALTAVLSLSGFFSNFAARPPRVALVPIIGMISIFFFNRAAMMKRLLQTIPPHWPVAMQSFRVGVELTLWLCFLAGIAPVQTTFEGSNFDVLVGLSAPICAFLIAKKNLSSRAVIAWNVICLLVLAKTIFTILTSVPGPLHLAWPGEPFTAFASWPIIWLPGFLAPFAVALHVFSIRQNVR